MSANDTKAKVDDTIDKATEKLIDNEMWMALGTGAVKIIAIMVITYLALRVGRSAIRNVFKVRSRSPLKFTERREATLSKLLENVLTYVIYFISLMTILSTLEIDVKGLIAGAGIVGLAVGFGAQNLVRDIITGFFIIFEDQFSVGDYVRIGSAEGTVEEIGLRTTKIKSWTGELHIFPNGNVTEVTNFSIHNSIAVVDVSIAYEENIEEAEKVMQELLLALPQKYEDLVNPPELLGVQTLGASDVVIRIVAETVPMRHWYMARMIRKEVKLCLDAHGIEIPFPRMVMYSRQDEEEIHPREKQRRLESE
ncbi:MULTISPECIES: mechanosensitive ion channel family protein [Rossellomorea]|uniref:mechanosensitive ion channel family protein n=1 Tax=Rossellomorea TaxID=2837508 RepID=UPI001CC972A8|nr:MULTISPECIES: mechanosensitive ion channel family protein [Rossellomorea]MCA0151319.1 mechanosensitive ion channel family protein [Rossellomorea vietnamensis]MCC5803497.1 mechanosensitive ion channel family protein [Rossellomorea vietnamensis]UTE77737.1 mechanosensitive ion channel family protein [Rossellomorea sp. KS-H15a]WGG45679.1 mechanosensitive ion channel family protein [Rossellomorea sp. DA94]